MPVPKNKFIILCLLGSLINDCYAGDVLWELGAGIGALDIPFYPGSSQSKSYVLPLPYLLLRSDQLEFDDGVQATFFKSSKIRLDISADLGIPVNSSDSVARSGMPDLDLVLQVGPSVEFTLSGGRFESSHTRFELPFRVAVATDLGYLDSVGWVFEPRFTHETHLMEKTGFSYLISGGLRYATREYHEYYYAVKAGFVTPSRPAFEPDGGYGGLFIDAEADWRSDDVIYFIFARYQNLSGAQFVNSPLVEQDDYWFFGAGFIWVFAGNI